MEEANKLIDSIKRQNIKPTPKWIFTTKRYLVWFLFIFSGLLGALAFSVILLVLKHSDLELTKHLGHSSIEMFLGLLPFIWLVLLIFGLILAIISIRKSWKGYKFTPLNIVVINLLFSITLGTLFFLAGGAQKLEESFAMSTIYEGIQERKSIIWSNPDQGLLSGTIVQVTDSTLTLLDFSNHKWTIQFQNAFIASRVALQEGEMIKIVGTMKSAQIFIAEEIRPWGLERGRARRGGQ